MNGNDNKPVRMLNACCDIFHEPGKVTLNMEMPGVGKDGLEVKVDGSRLLIHGTRGSRKIKGDFLIREIRDGDFHREFTLDDTIDREKISAAVKQGLVTIELQMKESVLPRKIAIT